MSENLSPRLKSVLEDLRRNSEVRVILENWKELNLTPLPHWGSSPAKSAEERFHEWIAISEYRRGILLLLLFLGVDDDE